MQQQQQPVPTVGGTFAGRYTIERELGRGGMATVYLAEELKHGRPVAIKVLRPDISAMVGTARFLREIGIAARLSHPHLVPLLDSGEAGGLLYYVSAYVSGGSLRDRLLAEGRLSVADAVRIARQVGGALDYAHREGFVHRDVKPENVLLADGHAMLTDFGIARAACRQDTGDAGGTDTVTSPGFVVGTPDYMSPEQAAGDRELDARSDVYSLACVLFEMLAGEPPFRGPSAWAVLGRHVSEAPRLVRTVRPEAPEAVEAAVARALAKDPAHRFATAMEFVAALRPGWLASPTAAAVRLPVRSIAVLPFVNASPDPDNEYLSDGLADELIHALSRVAGIRVASRTSSFALKGRPQDVRAIGALLDCGYVLEGTVRRAGAQLRITAQLTSTADGRPLWSRRWDRRLDDVLAIQDEIARSIVATLHATSFVEPPAPAAGRHPRTMRAYRLYLKGRYEWNRRTQEELTEGIRYFQEAIAEDPEYALAYTGLADCHALQADYRSVPVADGFLRAREYARRAIELDETLAEAHASLAWCLFVYDWEWEAAAAEFRRAIELEPLYATAHQWYAFLLHSRGELEEGLVEGHTAVELDPGSVSARRSLGYGHYYARRFEQALHHVERAIAMNPNAEETYRVLGLVLAVGGRPDEAVQVLGEALAMPGASSYTLATLGYAQARAGHPDGARDALAELHRQRSRGYVSPVAFATVHLGLGEADLALDWAERAYDDRRGWLAYLKVNPIFDPVRAHPRFEALVRRMRL